jgi:hypothetical protein
MIQPNKTAGTNNKITSMDVIKEAAMDKSQQHIPPNINGLKRIMAPDRNVGIP